MCLKTTAQIEVVVANKDKALEESEELREDFFEVVEAMAMHLMWNRKETNTGKNIPILKHHHDY